MIKLNTTLTYIFGRRKMFWSLFGLSAVATLTGLMIVSIPPEGGRDIFRGFRLFGEGTSPRYAVLCGVAYAAVGVYGLTSLSEWLFKGADWRQALLFSLAAPLGVVAVPASLKLASWLRSMLPERFRVWLTTPRPRA